MIPSRLLLTALPFMCAVCDPLRADGPPVVHLWPNGAPGFESRKDIPEKVTKKGNVESNVSNVNNPSLTV